MGEWQPIETAPKGVDLLVFSPSAKEQYVARMRKRGGRVFWVFADSPYTGRFHHCAPSHWQPLPEPPK